MKKLIIIASVLIIFASGQVYFAINYQTKECGTYQEGNEYGGYVLPQEWETFPIYESKIETQVGTCYGEKNGPEGHEYYSYDLQQCCEDLGFTFLSGDIGKLKGMRYWTPVTLLALCWLYWPVFLIIAAGLLLIFVVNKVRKSRGINNAGRKD